MVGQMSSLSKLTVTVHVLFSTNDRIQNQLNGNNFFFNSVMVLFTLYT